MVEIFFKSYPYNILFFMSANEEKEDNEEVMINTP